MTDRPTVAFMLPQATRARMFAPEQIDRLAAVADLADVFGDTSGRQAALEKSVVIITGWGTPTLDREILEAAPKLKLIAHSAGTVKPLVIPEVYKRGIRVTTAAAANAEPVAQFTVSMMVSMLKQVPWISNAFARGDKADVAERVKVLRELMDMEVGLVGASRVGREVIRLLQGYPDLRVKVYDPFLSKEDAAAMGVESSSLEEVCRCEVVSVHAPNLPQTHHMMNATTLGLMPDHAVFINTSRGALVDEAALLAEVQRRPIYVCLDVTDPEPPPSDSPLRAAPNILLTPHIAGAQRQACRQMGSLAIDTVLRFLRGEPLKHEVTAAMLATQA